MKLSSEKDLDALSSGILGALAISLLLIPSRLGPLGDGLPNWLLVWLAIFSYIVSLSIQTYFSI
ncbi:MAG TPA: hypothetical protein PKV19_04250, partial [Anaerolineales bacterium]|nr:hypothetical protein [Anaerolineales bacterium]